MVNSDTITIVAALAIVGILAFIWMHRPWQILYSPGMPKSPTKSGKWWYFDFPSATKAHVDYVMWLRPPTLSLGKTLYAKFTITGGGFIPQQFPTFPALVTLLIQRKGDNGSAVGKYANYRMYSSATQKLEAGTYELAVSLDANLWGGVYNSSDPAAFLDTISNVQSIGVVFGSDGGRGHGVYATQPSRFTLIDIGIR